MFTFQDCLEPAASLSSDILKCVNDVSESGLPPELVQPLPIEPCTNPEPESLVQPLHLVQVDSGEFVSMPELRHGSASENPDQVTTDQFLESVSH